MRATSNKTAGFSIIEMMVGIAIGLIVVTTAIVMLVSTLKAQKDITVSARLNQELGAVMAVMSNEIRRAGFRICDAEEAGVDCPLVDDLEGAFISYEYVDVIEIGDVDGAAPNDGDCILYRYNANVDENGNVPGDDDYFSEHRGFRLIANADGIGVVQIADDDTTDVVCNAGARWISLTNPDVINITGLIFSTTGSKCRNMSGNFYWVVGDNAKGLACAIDTELNGGCVDLNDPADPLVAAAGCSTTATKVVSDWVTDKFANPLVIPPPRDSLFSTHQININLQAELTRDDTVTKDLQSSVKVANPWVGKAP